MKQFYANRRGMLSQAESGPYFLSNECLFSKEPIRTSLFSAKKYAKSSSLKPRSALRSKIFDTTLLRPATIVKNLPSVTSQSQFIGDIFRKCTDVLSVFNRSPKLSASTIFCVLFSGLLALSALGQEANGLIKSHALIRTAVAAKPNPSSIEFLQNSVKPRGYNEDPDKILKQFPTANLAKYPSVLYDIDGDLVDLVEEGEDIPDYILDMPLWVLNYPDSLTDVINLRQLAGKGFLLLEFWNSHCKPCLESVIRWEENQSNLGSGVHFLGVALDQPYRVPLEVEKRNWTSTHVMGRSALALSKFFFNRFSMGPLVWIKDGKLFGISQGIPKDLQLFKDILSGKVAALPAEIIFTRD